MPGTGDYFLMERINEARFTWGDAGAPQRVMTCGTLKTPIWEQFSQGLWEFLY